MRDALAHHIILKGFTTGAMITMYDATGRVMCAAVVKEAVHTINLSKAMPGVCFIQVKKGGDITIKKIMKN